MRPSRGVLSTLVALGTCSSLVILPVQSFSPASSTSSRHVSHSTSFSFPSSNTNPLRSTAEASSAASESSSSLDSHAINGAAILKGIADATPASLQWGESFDLPESEVAFYALFAGIKSNQNTALGITGRPFHLKQSDIVASMKDQSSGDATTQLALDKLSDSPFAGFFTFEDLARAVEEDFLDANRGSTNNAQGWKVTGVSKPRGSSFEDARMTLDEVNASLEKGTVIFNAIGAHIPKLSGPTLACCDASSLPNALNMYVTAPGKKTSAPPHTDRQDVVVVQTQGRKHWRVYTPPNAALDPLADMYARGKGEDALPLHALESTYGCTKLIDVTLDVGDILFIPAGFPHTTDTAEGEPGDDAEQTTSIHLTFNLDTHVWDLDYLSARRLALARAGVVDTALGQTKDTDNRYVGKANTLPADIRAELFEALPLGLLEEDAVADALVEEAAVKLEKISHMVDQETASAVPASVWMDTIARLRQQGIELFDVHRDMYLAAIEEGRIRKTEMEMTAHLTGEALTRARAMTPEKMQRLSLFRVRDYYDKINQSKEALVQWSKSGSVASGGSGAGSASASGGLPANWEYTVPLQVGDQVEADLGGAMFPATVSKVSGDKYDVDFFDGDKELGLDRGMIKLLNPPAAPGSDDEDDFDTTGLTPKEIKKLRKKAEKKKAKKGRK